MTGRREKKSKGSERLLGILSNDCTDNLGDLGATNQRMLVIRSLNDED